MAGPDRKAALLAPANTTLTGIDFVSVAASQTQLDVYFLREPTTLTPPLTIAPDAVTIAGEDDPSMPITGVAWAGPFEGRTVLRVTTARPGDFGRYWLTIAGDGIDPFFRTIEINFKASCPREIDCAPPPHLCPADPPVEIVVDGSARDFWSLRTALLGFANLRNPRWQDRLEADVGVMLVELMAALGDELAYYQDRVARETHFASASQRRSLRRHTRLVDYDLADGLGATGWVAITAVATTSPPTFDDVKAGTQVWARSDGGRIVPFEIGNGLADVIAKRTVRVHVGRNKIPAHRWEGDEPDPLARLRPLPATCLPAGATSVYVQGHVQALFTPGERVFLVTQPPADRRDMPIRRVLVTLTAIHDETDPLGGTLGTGADVTRLSWREPTPFEMDIAWLSVLGNVAPVTAGETFTKAFSIGPNTQGELVAVERAGADGSIAFLYTVPDHEGLGLVRLGDDPHTATPEIDLVELALPSGIEGVRWSYRRALIGSNSAEPEDTVFTLDDGSWQRAVGYRRPDGEVVHYDYIANVGATVRFGDGEFGRMPARGFAEAGKDRFFRVRFRLGNGARGNLPADTLRWASFDGKATFADLGLPIASITNPLATSGGVDPETLDEARRDAPEAFRAVTYRAVRPEDYDEVAGRLRWVQRAGTTFRWTGSWQTAFTTADPRHEDDLPADQRVALTEYLDRFRMAGREVHVLAPRYADLQVTIKVCVAPGSYPADVERAIRLELIGRGGVRPVVGFFDPDRFTFGTALDRSDLEAAVQRVPGVRAVKQVWIARPGFFERRPFYEARYQPAIDEVIRVDNDPLHPDRGSISIQTEGGA